MLQAGCTRVHLPGRCVGQTDAQQVQACKAADDGQHHAAHMACPPAEGFGGQEF